MTVQGLAAMRTQPTAGRVVVVAVVEKMRGLVVVVAVAVVGHLVMVNSLG